MTIQQGNLKLLAAVVMDDADNNGGPPSSNVIPDGSSNTVFPDISELDRAGGRVQFRKIFPWVDEAATSTFYGANACLSDIPVDANTGCVLFEAASVSETQADVIARIGGVTGSLPAGFASLISTEIICASIIPIQRLKYRFDVSTRLDQGFEHRRGRHSAHAARIFCGERRQIRDQDGRDRRYRRPHSPRRLLRHPRSVCRGA